MRRKLLAIESDFNAALASPDKLTKALMVGLHLDGMHSSIEESGAIWSNVGTSGLTISNEFYTALTTIFHSEQNVDGFCLGDSTAGVVRSGPTDGWDYRSEAEIEFLGSQDRLYTFIATLGGQPTGAMFTCYGDGTTPVSIAFQGHAFNVPANSEFGVSVRGSVAGEPWEVTNASMGLVILPTK